MKAKYVILVLFLAFVLHSCGVYYEPRGAYYPRTHYAHLYYPRVHYVAHYHGGFHNGGGHFNTGHYGGGRR